VRICYVRQSDRGARLVGIRLVGEMLDRGWAPHKPLAPQHEQDENTDPLPAIRAAAEWIRTLLAAGGSEPDRLPILCLDPDGMACSWVTAPGGNPALIAAVARSGPAGPEGLEFESAAPPTPLSYFAPSPLESTIEPVRLPDPAVGRSDRAARPAPQRVAVIGAADAAARVLIDELDRLGVECGAVITLWHALAAAWDRGPAAPSANVVAESSPVVATVLIDAQGRLVWAWSRSRALLAGGMFRVTLASPPEGSDEPPRPAPDPADAARLAAEWLSWSVQFGIAPVRVLVLMCRDADDSQTGAEFGASLARAWGGATVDLIGQEDPILATLQRLRAPAADDPLAAPPAATALAPAPPSSIGATRVASLTRRPSRTHRRLYRAAAAAIAAAAIFLAVVAWRFNALAAQKRDLADSLVRLARQDAQEVGGQALALARTDELLEELRGIIRARRQQLEPPDIASPTMPVFEEVATLALVLGNDRVELQELTVDQTVVSVVIQTQDVGRAERVLAALRSIAGSHVDAWRDTYAEVGTGESRKVRATFNGVWSPQAGRARPANEGGAP
jgi:hypothetical protein